VVASANESSLVAALAGGGKVTFAMDGTIYLTNTIVVSNNTVLDGTGHNLAISGSNAVQIFIVNSNTTLAMTNLTLRDGFFQVADSYAPSVGGYGGAIYNAGTLQMTGCSFVSNSASGDTAVNASEGDGGAIYNTGIITAWDCVFIGNSAAGGIGSPPFPFISAGGAANGGALFKGNQATCVSCMFSNNTAFGGMGGSYVNEANYAGASGGGANGGAICNKGSLVASNNTFAQNVATGGQGGTGGSEYNAFYVYNGGAGGAGGSSAGGAVCCLGGSSILVNDTFWSNSAFGGTEGTGGEGSPARCRPEITFKGEADLAHSWQECDHPGPLQKGKEKAMKSIRLISAVAMVLGIVGCTAPPPIELKAVGRPRGYVGSFS